MTRTFDLILRSGRRPRLEGWATGPGAQFILRDASLRDAPQDESGQASHHADAESPNRWRLDRALHHASAEKVSGAAAAVQPHRLCGRACGRDPLADREPWLDAAIDWDTTIAFRRHLWSLGLGVAEAMDTPSAAWVWTGRIRWS